MAALNVDNKYGDFPLYQLLPGIQRECVNIAWHHPRRFFESVIYANGEKFSAENHDGRFDMLVNIKYNLDIIFRLRQSPKFMAYHTNIGRDLLKAPKEWPEYIAKELNHYGLTPYEIGLKYPTNDEASFVTWNQAGNVFLLGYTMGLPLDVMSELTGVPEDAINIYMKQAVDELFEDEYFCFWASNPPPAIYGDRVKSFKAARAHSLWPAIQQGLTPKDHKPRSVRERYAWYVPQD